MVNEINKEFGEVISKNCSFCGKTYDIDKFYSIPPISSDTALMKATYNTLNLFKQTPKKKRVVDDDEGICLRCLIRGLLHICENDKDKVFDYINKFCNLKTIETLKN